MFPEFSTRGNKVRNLPSNSHSKNWKSSFGVFLSLKFPQPEEPPSLSLPPSPAWLFQASLLGMVPWSFFFLIEINLPVSPASQFWGSAPLCPWSSHQVLSLVTTGDQALDCLEAVPEERLWIVRCKNVCLCSKGIFSLQMWISPKDCDNCVTFILG